MRERGFDIIIFALCLGLLFSCRGRNPRITSIYPRIGGAGETLTIQGENFGPGRDESYVAIADTILTASSYIEWNNNVIQVKIPEFGESGLVYVYAGGRKSNPLLFSSRSIIPQKAEGTSAGLLPRISSVSPSSASVGQPITISGSGFGSSREGGGVFFAWDAESSPSAPAEARGPLAVEVLEDDFGYELWSEREIRVHIPDGAVSGNLEVRTARGASRPVFFEVTGRPGTKTYRDKRSYAITYSTDIRVADASSFNILYLWFPRPSLSSSQRNIQNLGFSMPALVDNYQGTTLFRLQNLEAQSRTRISVSYLVEVYAVETSVNLPAVRQGRESPAAVIYTLPSPLVPSDSQEIIREARAITQGEQNPYLKAWRIYEWLIREGGIRERPVSWGALEALRQKRGDSYTAALLFCALARAAGIPALPVAGVLTDRSLSTSRHYWAEFWLDGFGWIPLDPALGTGAAPPSFILPEDRETYYFGSLDSQRITFSRGETALSPMDPRGRLFSRERDYALQSLWEEAVGGLESYSSLWSDVTITGVYME